MSCIEDLTGQKFGRLTVISRDGYRIFPSGQKGAKWLCKCDCGNIVSVMGRSLKSGNTQSCGCYRLEKIRESFLHDLSGKKFGRLTVLELSGRTKGGRSNWLCRCDCGNLVCVTADSLVTGRTKSCGCIHRENCSKLNYKHGLRGKRIYKIWKSMKGRCYTKGDTSYKAYGGRGIGICDEWLGENGAENFAKWAYESGYDENAPRGKCTLDRIDSNGNYEPSNCRWITIANQQLNKRTNVLISFSGEEKTLKEWSEALGIKYTTLHHRLFREKWSVEKAFTTPVKKE